MPFSDCNPYLNLTNTELLIFPDGSVKGQKGGFGYLQIRSKLYKLWHLNSPHGRSYFNKIPDLITELQTRIQSPPNNTSYYHSEEYSDYLTLRCTIKYCEVLAIHTAIMNFAKRCEYTLTSVQRYTKLRIISDSLTVLRYIDGDYFIRTPHMKKLVDEIHWNTTCIQEYLPNIHIEFQWTKSHFECFGNHYADYLALCGRLRLKRK